MKEKVFFKRIEHIWEYYKVLVIGIIGGIILLLMLDIPSLIAKPETIWGSYYVNSTLTSDEAQNIVEDFQKDFLQDKDEKHEYIFDTNLTFSIEQTAAGDFDQMAKFTALIAAKELDFIIAEEPILEHYASLGGFIQLDFLLSEEEKEKWEEDFIYLAGEDGIERAYALDLTHTILNSGSNYNGEKILGSIPLNSEEAEITQQYIQYLLVTKSED